MASRILVPARVVRGLHSSPPLLKCQQAFLMRKKATSIQTRNYAKNEMQSIISPRIPAPIGPYSHATKTPFAIYCSGQLPAGPDGNIVQGTMKDRTRACLSNLKEVLTAADSSLDKIVKVQIFLTDMKDFSEMNEEYIQWIKHAPARSCVAVKQLPKGVDIEIECIALP